MQSWDDSQKRALKDLKGLKGKRDLLWLSMKDQLPFESIHIFRKKRDPTQSKPLNMHVVLVQAPSQFSEPHIVVAENFLIVNFPRCISLKSKMRLDKVKHANLTFTKTSRTEIFLWRASTLFIHTMTNHAAAFTKSGIQFIMTQVAKCSFHFIQDEAIYFAHMIHLLLRIWQ